MPAVGNNSDEHVDPATAVTSAIGEIGKAIGDFGKNTWNAAFGALQDTGSKRKSRFSRDAADQKAQEEAVTHKALTVGTRKATSDEGSAPRRLEHCTSSQVLEMLVSKQAHDGSMDVDQNLDPEEGEQKSPKLSRRMHRSESYETRSMLADCSHVSLAVPREEDEHEEALTMF